MHVDLRVAIDGDETRLPSDSRKSPAGRLTPCLCSVALSRPFNTLCCCPRALATPLLAPRLFVPHRKSAMHDLGTFDGAGAGGSGSHQGLAFSLSKILAEKMARNARLASSSSSSSSSGGSSGSGSRASGSGALEQSYGEGAGAGAAWLIQRCPPATMARLDSDGGCFWCAPSRRPPVFPA